jgi:anthranilate synthase/aminodeoxychorismate synthase-like glutamine amidotransferase
MPVFSDAAPRILVIDHHDSFTFNIVNALELAGARCSVVASDAESAAALLASAPSGILLSAGPCTPREAGVSLSLTQKLLRQPRPPPLLGLCLGHQTIACALGGSLRRARRALHGKTALIRHDGRSLFEGIASPLAAARYNSLVVDADALPAELCASAWDEHGEIMALRHRLCDVEGVQFHPESWLSDGWTPLFRSWVERCARYACEAAEARAG